MAPALEAGHDAKPERLGGADFVPVAAAFHATGGPLRIRTPKYTHRNRY
jgi:hypothetical protein